MVDVIRTLSAIPLWYVVVVALVFVGVFVMGFFVGGEWQYRRSRKLRSFDRRDTVDSGSG